MTTWDRDGDGIEETLVVAGWFTTLGGVPIDAIGAWDGETWLPLGGTPGMRGSVLALTTFDLDGPGGNPPSLIMGGGHPGVYGNVGVLQDGEWLPLGGGVANNVHSFHAMDLDGPSGPAPRELHLARGDWPPGTKVERWTGSAWTQVGSRFEGGTHPNPRLAEFDFDGTGPEPARLVLAGNFWGIEDPIAGWLPYSYAVYFDGGDWQHIAPIPTGVQGFRSVCAYDPDGNGKRLYVSGNASGSYQSLWELGEATWTPVQGFDRPSVWAYPLAPIDHDGEPCTAERLYTGYSGGFSWWDGAALTREGFDAGNTDLNIVRYDPDGIGGEPPQIVYGGSFSWGGNLARQQATDCPPVLWEVTSRGWHQVYMGPYFEDAFSTGVDLTSPAGEWENDLLTPEGYPSRSFTSITGVWDHSDAGFLLNGWRTIGDCGYPVQLHSAGSDIEIKAWVCGSTTTRAEYAYQYTGLLIGDGRFTTVRGGERRSEGGTLHINEGVPWTLGTTGETRLFSAYPGVRYSLAFRDRVTDWAGYECVNSTIDLEAMASVVKVPPRLASSVIVDAPSDQTVCEGAEVRFDVSVTGSGPFFYVWRRDGQVLSDGITSSGSVISGSSTPSLEISHSSGMDAGDYDCIVSNACSIATSEAAALYVTTCCAADYNGHGDPGDILDLLDFFEDFGACDQQPAPCGTLGDPDVNGDTIIDILDFLDFFEAFGQGC